MIDHLDSPYFKSPDYYNMDNTSSRIILKQFETIQQTTKVTCGACAVYMVLNYYGIDKYSEKKLAKYLDTTSKGVSLSSIVKLFKKLGVYCTSSLEHPKFKNYKQFRKFVIKLLKKKIPIIVENVDWGGHWRVIVGIDTMSKDSTLDDTLILADSYNTHNHNQDGFMVENAEKFFTMFFDHNLLPENEREQPWVIAVPKD